MRELPQQVVAVPGGSARCVETVPPNMNRRNGGCSASWGELDDVAGELTAQPETGRMTSCQSAGEIDSLM
jgi:hypothetical protein